MSSTIQEISVNVPMGTNIHRELAIDRYFRSQVNPTVFLLFLAQSDQLDLYQDCTLSARTYTRWRQICEFSTWREDFWESRLHSKPPLSADPKRGCSRQYFRRQGIGWNYDKRSILKSTQRYISMTYKGHQFPSTPSPPHTSNINKLNSIQTQPSFQNPLFP